MLEIPSLPDNTGAPNDAVVDGGAAAAACSGPDSDGPKDHRGLAGAANRWPREETMALLRIRSEMDVAFRDSNPKAPLWQQISRRLGELGYNRSAKKCKEKFENIYKYHRRTKEGREGRPNRKTYRFFDQLEALHYSHLLPNSPEHNPQTPTPTTTTVNTNVVHHAMPCSVRFPTANHADYSTTSSNSKESGDDGDDDDTPTGKKKRRRVTEYFERMMKQVMEKQESLHNKFLEVLEKREQDRIVREKEWKMQELARIQRERELLAQERSMAAAKDAALLAILTKITDPSTPGEPLVLVNNTTNNNMNVVNPVPENHDKNKDKDKDKDEDKDEREGNDVINVEKPKQEHYRNVGSNSKLMHMSSSRWPKEEVEALIRLRTNMDVEYEGNNNNGGKGPLWEEISSAMKKIGYHRSAKRCKEKWENINKYFKRMKEKNKRRPEDSKTCPYFHQLDALYSKKPRTKVSDDQSGGNGNGNNDDQLKAEELLMHIMNGQEELPQSSQPEPEATDHKDDDGDHMVEPIVLQ